MTSALVYGLAVAGASTVRALTARGVEVVVADDETTTERIRLAGELGVEILERPSERDLESLVRRSDLVVPSPGVPESHLVIELALRLGIDLASEIELAYRWEQERSGGPRPILAITGTDGKTTTTLLAVEMLRAAGRRTIDAGNTDTPLVDAIELDLDALVVECTSFRLAWTPTFRADAAAWLNFAPDHLNWHRSMGSYEQAKAQIFANQTEHDVAVGFADDEVVMARLAHAPARHRSFGLEFADYRVEDGLLVGPDGVIADSSTMRRALPHDITNALAASALVLETGLADTEAIRSALGTFVGPPHRLELIGQWDGIRWFNDSKATTPHAAAAAISSFERIVLLAGGYDKGVDLSAMAADQNRVRAVVAFGATAPSIADAFAGVSRIAVVPGLDEAVDAAHELAMPGDVVVLSPGCASFDQYTGFEARGDHFRTLVEALHVADAQDVTASRGGVTR